MIDGYNHCNSKNHKNDNKNIVIPIDLTVLNNIIVVVAKIIIIIIIIGLIAIIVILI